MTDESVIAYSSVWTFSETRHFSWDTFLPIPWPMTGTGLYHFRYGPSQGPVPELDSMCVVPFPVLGYAISSTVIVRVRTRTGLYVHQKRAALLLIFVRIKQRSKGESGSAFLIALSAKSGVFCYVHYGKVR